MTKYQLDIVLSFHLQKIWGQLVKKRLSYGAFCRANPDFLENPISGHIRHFVAILKLGPRPQFGETEKKYFVGPVNIKSCGWHHQ